MKCPKCEYVGFEAADRCRHCGYEFSLLGEAGVAAMREHASPGAEGPPCGEDLSSGDLPLFRTPLAPVDQPLVSAGNRPRSPVAVRRATVKPRPVPPPRTEAAPPEPLLELVGRELERAEVRSDAPAAPPRIGRLRRVEAAAIDAAILTAMAAVVVYLTLRMATLSVAEWRMLPPVPLVTFLGMVGVAYFAVFTAFGGQTIGKMAVGLRVVAADDGRVGPGRAMLRSLLVWASALVLGLPVLPWLFGRDGRMWHDRLAQTRVVSQ